MFSVLTTVQKKKKERKSEEPEVTGAGSRAGLPENLTRALWRHHAFQVMTTPSSRSVLLGFSQITYAKRMD